MQCADDNSNIGSRANPHIDLEACSSTVSMIEERANERCGDEMVFGTFIVPAALRRMNGCRLLTIDDDDRWIWQWQVEVTAF